MEGKEMPDRVEFKSAGATSKSRQLRQFFEDGVDFDTAVKNMGILEGRTMDNLRASWAVWQRAVGEN
jgi:hypothetical protein